MPYATTGELPKPVKQKLKGKKRRQWMHVWNSSYDTHGDESRAFASAWAAVKKGSRIVTDFNFFLPLTKVEKTSDGGCIISGYASTPALDLDGEIVALDAVKKALPGYWQWRNIREMHTSSAVGVAKEADIDERGLFLTSKIVDKDAVKKCLEGVYKGYSIGGKKLAKSGNTITEIELVEISVVDRPANPECSFEVKKSASKSAGAYLTKLGKPRVDPDQQVTLALAKGVSALAKKSKKTKKDALGQSNMQMKCAAHGIAGCMTCGDPEVEKRDFNAKERREATATGAAMAGGRFPIENKEDLKNARRLAGHAKDKKAVRAHIKRRAEALGVKLPDNASKKLAKRLIAKEKSRRERLYADLNKRYTLGVPISAAPSFLTLAADDGGATVGSVGLGHAADFGKGGLTKREHKLMKRMGIAGSLSYCFDSIRDAQRSLLREAELEGGDKKDANLARDLGTIAQKLAAVIGQKAEHEGAEALDLSDADDKRFLDLMGEGFAMSKKSTDLEKAFQLLEKAGKSPTRAMRMAMARGDMKKARKAAGDLEECMKALHAMHKATYLAKAAKKKKDDNDADDFDHAGAMEKLNKGYAMLKGMQTMIKSASTQLKKAAGMSAQSPTSGNANYQVPAGVKDLSISTLDNAGGAGDNFEHGMITPFPGKSAKPKLMKGMVSADHAEALARAAAAEAKVEVLSSMPAAPVHGRKPVAFDVSKIADDKDAGTAIMKGVDPSRLADPEGNRGEIGKMITNMIVGGHGKSVFDPSFRGAAGAKA